MLIFEQKFEKKQKKLTFYVDKPKKMQYNKNCRKFKKKRSKKRNLQLIKKK